MAGESESGCTCEGLADRVAELEKALIVIGERAVVDWDNATLGMVDEALKHTDVARKRYRDWVKEVLRDAPDRYQQVLKILAVLLVERGGREARISERTLVEFDRGVGVVFERDSLNNDLILRAVKHVSQGGVK